MRLPLALLSLLTVTPLLGGCGSGDTTATKSEESSFRNPPKEPPAAAAEGMRKGMEAAEKARQQGGN